MPRDGMAGRGWAWWATRLIPLGLLALAAGCADGRNDGVGDGGVPTEPGGPDRPGSGLCGWGFNGEYVCTRSDWPFETSTNGANIRADYTSLTLTDDVLIMGSRNYDRQRAFSVSLEFPRDAGTAISCDSQNVEMKVFNFAPENGRNGTSRRPGGGCTVQLNRAPTSGGVLEGTFEGTAVSYGSNEQWVVVGGRFQVELPE